MKITKKLLMTLALSASMLIIAIGAACKQNASDSNVKPQVSENGEPRLVVQTSLPKGSAVFSKDGKLLATANDTTSTVLDIDSGREIRTFSNNSNYKVKQDDSPLALAFSSDGKLFATFNGGDGTLRIWDINNGTLLSKIEVGENSMIGGEELEFSDDQKSIIARANQSEIVVDIGLGKVINKKKRESDGFEKEIPIYSWGKNFKLVPKEANYGDGYKIDSYTVTDSKNNTVLFAGKLTESPNALSPDGKLIATSPSIIGKDGNELAIPIIHLLDASNGKVAKTFGTSSNGNYDMFFENKKLLSIIPLNLTHNTKASNDRNIPIKFQMKSELKGDTFNFNGYSKYGNPLTAVSSDGKLIAFDSSDGIEILDTQTLKIISALKNVFNVKMISPKGKYIVTDNAIWESATGIEKFKYDNGSGEYFEPIIVFSKDEKFIFANCILEKKTLSGSDNANIQNTETQPLDETKNQESSSIAEPETKVEEAIWSLKTGEKQKSLSHSEEYPTDLRVSDISPDGKLLILARSSLDAYNSDGSIEIWNIANGQLIRTLATNIISTESLAFSPDAKLIISGGQDRIIRIWDVKSGQKLKELKGHSGDISRVSFSNDGKLILSQSNAYNNNAPDNTTKVWDVSSEKELLQMVKFQNGDWIVTTPDGRFDTNNLDKVEGMHWIMPSEPLRPLPIEIFMRQYYEPRLLARVLRCNETKNCEQEFKPLPALNTLNRTQPSVKIADIKPDSDNTVEVTVEVVNAKSEGQKDTFGNPLESGVYDVRLFRDGQLVGYAPKTADSTQTTWEWIKSFFVGKTESNGKVELDKDGKAILKFSKIKLPRTGVDKLEFSVYAFNVDQIKSETSRQTYAIKPNTVKGRAYIISLGVNANAKDNLNLRYAANDARQSQENLTKRLREQGQYEEVVNIPLISDFNVSLNGNTITAQDATMQQVKTGQKTVTENTATKAHFTAWLSIAKGVEEKKCAGCSQRLSFQHKVKVFRVVLSAFGAAHGLCRDKRDGAGQRGGRTGCVRLSLEGRAISP